MKHFKYLTYVLKHKWFVFLECVKASIRLNMPSLIWLGLIHDWSKFRWSELKPYANHFYGREIEKNCYKCESIIGSQCKYNCSGIGQGEQAVNCKDFVGHDPDFDFAWLLHQNRNSHHWIYWLSLNRKKEVTVMEMPIKYTEEMLADWIGAAKAKGQGGVHTPVWYDRVKDTLILGEATHRRVKNAVDRLREGGKR